MVFDGVSCGFRADPAGQARSTNIRAHRRFIAGNRHARSTEAAQWRTAGPAQNARARHVSIDMQQITPSPNQRNSGRSIKHSNRGHQASPPVHTTCMQTLDNALNYIAWQWRNFVPYLCPPFFAAILWVKRWEISVSVIMLKQATLCWQVDYHVNIFLDQTDSVYIWITR